MTHLEDLASYSPQELRDRNGELLAIRYDVAALLQDGISTDWQKAMSSIVIEAAEWKELKSDDPTCREEAEDTVFQLLITPGEKVQRAFPFMDELYHGVFYRMMQAAMMDEPGLHSYSTFGEAAHFITQLPRNQLPDNLQDHGLHRIDAHVDERPTGIFVVQAPYSTGQLVVGPKNARGVAAVNAGGTSINHISGTFLAFPHGRELTHYTCIVGPDEPVRVVASVDYLAADQRPDDARLYAINKRIGNV